MSATPVILSDRSIFEVDGVEFAFISGDVEVAWVEHDTNDSSSGTHEDAQLGRRRLNASNITIFRHEGASIHGAPFNINNQDAHDLKIYDYEGANPYHSPTFLFTRASVTRNAQTGEPIKVTFSGRSHSTIFLPDET